ncbi:MAG: 2-isopropylmalate synthase [Candidatus Eiseniibacteriota bacterium]|nr:MAG: 2-isopropylmalate synthase [Candidatus Eisenbacteria bacterium]
MEFDDETLRDGLQSPSVTDPSIEDKKKMLHLMDKIGIQGANIGLPGAGPRTAESTRALAEEIARAKLKIKPNCAARTLESDIVPVLDITQKTGVHIEVSTFIGSSPIRQYAEGWTPDFLLELTEKAVRFCIQRGHSVMYVTEDTTRARPDTISKLYTTAIECGARRVCVCDTVGHATPAGARNLVNFVRGVVKETGEDVKVDWHGHRDRGLSVPNAIAAVEAGADRLHGTALGIGERAGNVPIDLLLVNLTLLGLIDLDLSHLPAYCRLVSEACRVPLIHNYPVVGRDAFRTATGVHAAAVIKAEKKGHAWLADRVYSGVPAGMFGLEQVIEIGPMSGESNVVYWLKKRNIEPDKELVAKIFDRAKYSKRLLADKEILSIVDAHASSAEGSSGQKEGENGS